MRPFILLVAFLASFPIRALAAEAAPLVYLAGDSTMSHKPLDLPERGWGMALGGLMKDPAMVQNHAVNGRSTKSFINEGRWQRLIGAVRPGDFVIVQFGHNDEKVENPSVGTNPQTEFRDNLRRFIREVRARDATPILATPIARRKFDAAGKLTPTHGVYPAAIRAVAEEEKVGLIDLEASTNQWLQAEGDEPTKKYFMWIADGAHPLIPGGRKDDTHLVDAGAFKVASLAAAEIKAKNLPLAKWVK